ncbi:MAG: hypothetical protein GKR95_15390 [Gammaproteobacteria bacterium]|nr:hypothetical protein [Gammaproteobacteria bacterium]
MASSGGEAKHFIDQGLVKVNGKVETRKRRKLLANDEVVFAQNRIAVSNSEVNAQIHGDSEMVGRN